MSTMTAEEMIAKAETIAAALAADATNPARSSVDRSYVGDVDDSHRQPRVMVRSNGERIGYIEICENGIVNYRGIKRGTSACEQAVARGVALIGGAK